MGPCRRITGWEEAAEVRSKMPKASFDLVVALVGPLLLL